jgi:membrane associated rhomboid family serine protease
MGQFAEVRTSTKVLLAVAAMAWLVVVVVGGGVLDGNGVEWLGALAGLWTGAAVSAFLQDRRGENT